MNLTGFRPLDRGEMSILAALVLISILGATGLFLQTVGPGPLAQTASVGGVLAQADPAGSGTGSSPASGSTPTPTPNASQQVKQAQNQEQSVCQQLQQQTAAKKANDSGAITTSYTTGSTVEKNKCVAVVFDPNSNAAKIAQNNKVDPHVPQAYQCVGEISKVKMDKSGKGSIESSPNSDLTSPDNKAGTCKTQFCDADGKNCGPTSNMSGAQSVQQWATDPSNFSQMSPAQQASALSFGAISQSQQDVLQDVLQDKQIATQNAQDALKSATANCDGQLSGCNVAIDQQIADAAGLQCSSTQGSGSNTQCVVDAQKASDQLSSQQKSLNDQLGQLEKAQVGLTPGGFQGPCPAGQTNNGSTCVSTTQTQQSSNTGGGNSTFGGGLDGLLKGLAQGFGQSMAQQQQRPNSSGTGSSAPAQACSTDSAVYAQQQQQYQSAMQQYNYQLQQYNAQLQANSYNASNGYYVTVPQQPQMPSPCYPSTQQQCSVQPTQPSSTSCSGGSWTPQYSGNCVVGWRCSNLGASISCQPQTADVGMQVAISYSCAQGTATGSGFTTSNASAGTSTATVAQPADGTNTITYGLTCTSGVTTSGAQCSVQIVQPSITLVANPRTIASGKTSLLGWITTGMKSCVMSSPNDAAFTSQNSSNTSVNGTAQTLPATSTQQYILNCQTFSGGTKSASTTVTVQ